MEAAPSACPSVSRRSNDQERMRAASREGWSRDQHRRGTLGEEATNERPHCVRGEGIGIREGVSVRRALSDNAPRAELLPTLCGRAERIRCPWLQLMPLAAALQVSTSELDTCRVASEAAASSRLSTIQLRLCCRSVFTCVYTIASHAHVTLGVTNTASLFNHVHRVEGRYNFSCFMLPNYWLPQTQALIWCIRHCSISLYKCLTQLRFSTVLSSTLEYSLAWQLYRNEVPSKLNCALRRYLTQYEAWC